MTDTIIVTGGAGFSGGNFALQWLQGGRGPLVNLDNLTCAGNLRTLASVAQHSGYSFLHRDICDAELPSALLKEHQPRGFVGFAAKTHVDLSIRNDRRSRAEVSR